MHQQPTPNSGSITDVLKFNPSLSHLVPMNCVLSKPCSMAQAVNSAANRFDGPWGSNAFSALLPRKSTTPNLLPCVTNSPALRHFRSFHHVLQRNRIKCKLGRLLSAFSHACRYSYVTCPIFCYDCCLHLSLAHYHYTSKRSWVVIDRSYQFITR